MSSDEDYYGNDSDAESLDSGIINDDSDCEMGLEDTVTEKRSDEFKYEVLCPDKLNQAMNKDIEEINNIINPPLPVATISVLLNHLKWDKQRLFELYYEDPDKLFKEAKISRPKPTKVKHAGKGKRSTAIENVFCEICFSKSPKSNMTKLPECEHLYCNECWSSYLRNKIVDDGVGSMIFCPETACDVLVDSLTVCRLLKDDKKAQKTYNYLVSDNFVTKNCLMKWCPAPDCPNAIKVDTADAKPAACNCGHTFCFSCAQNWHSPVSCKLLKKWIKKCQDDSETANWMSSNTKDCPKCDSTIEKNGGCNHMICRKCKYDFCWMCLKEWKSHNDYYNCNKYDKDEAAEAKKSESRAALQRYMFYYERYVNHSKSLKFQEDLKDKVENIMKYLQDKENMTWSEVQFLQKAFETLRECRRVLMHTYIFAFYIQKNNHIEMFENNQRDLEIAVEKLCENLERQDLASMDSQDMKVKVQDITRYCASRNKALLDHVDEGFERGEKCGTDKWWVFKETDCE